MQKRFDDNLHRLIPETGAGVILAVSGGRDSMCMANLFRYSYLDLHPVIAHVNFHLRGGDSDLDFHLVRGYAHEWGVPFESIDFDTSAFAEEKGISVEMAARELRYGWFEEIAEKHDCRYIAVAHHLNDRVETLFLNLTRGTGVRGLAGIRERNGRIIRPILSFTRNQIDEYMRKNKVPYRDDCTNFESEIPRNRIRNVIFPEFEKINPSFLKTVSRDMTIFEQAGDLLDELFRKSYSEYVSAGEGSEVLRISIEALLRSGYTAFWLYRILEPYGFNSAHVFSITSALEGLSGKEFYSETHYLLKDRNLLKLYPLEAVETDVEDVYVESLPYDNTLDGIHFSLIDGRNVEDFRALSRDVLAINVDRVRFPLKLRIWRTGDRFRPIGMKGFKKVSDFLVDLKLDRFQKRKVRVVTTEVDGDERIVGIAGFRLDDRFKI